MAGELDKVTKRWSGQVFGTGPSAFARGALIWIAPGVPFVKSWVFVDSEDRYVPLEGTLDGKSRNLVSIYAPNVGQGKFFQRISPASFHNTQA